MEGDLLVQSIGLRECVYACVLYTCQLVHACMCVLGTCKVILRATHTIGSHCAREGRSGDWRLCLSPYGEVDHSGPQPPPQQDLHAHPPSCHHAAHAAGPGGVPGGHY